MMIQSFGSCVSVFLIDVPFDQVGVTMRSWVMYKNYFLISISRNQGFCKALMTTIERLLGVLKVERLVLPAVKDAESVWVNTYGFSRMEDTQVRPLILYYFSSHHFDSFTVFYLSMLTFSAQFFYRHD